MKQNDLPMALGRVKIDGGTQVREQLNDAWVRELMEAYERGDDVPPLLVYFDKKTEDYWLVDGFHRYAALDRLHKGRGEAHVHIREGTLEHAKLEAARLSKFGSQPRTEGDKRKAILVAYSTEHGRTLTQQQLANWVGCSQKHVSEVLSGERPGFIPGYNNPVLEAAESRRTKLGKNASPREMLWARVEGVILADIDRDSVSVAKETGCHVDTVRARREALGLPPIPKGKKRKSIVKQSIAEAKSSRERRPSGTITTAGEREIIKRHIETHPEADNATIFASVWKTAHVDPLVNERRMEAVSHVRNKIRTDTTAKVIPFDRAAQDAATLAVYKKTLSALSQLTPELLRKLAVAANAMAEQREKHG